ncbi:hypothetical protein N7510_011795, partial [Penicillium lagena]|uniref:uncharacterized protein n=1 Tax=Penicillium lagena TaxID=94218 RepID=UPI0025406A97
LSSIFYTYAFLNFFALLAPCGLALVNSYPTVTIQNGTLVGNSINKVDSFIGIPYAQPPVGDLRLRPPQTFNKHFGVLKVQDLATGCVSMDMSPVNTTGLPEPAVGVIEFVLNSATGPSSENCLTINVQRPSGTERNAKLPVLLWIYGGGFELGNTQSYDGTGIISKSVDMGEPVLFVAFNYRLNAFGFLHGKELQEEGSTNLGLRDQRKAIEWVAENIAAFGGDPDRVTLWGQSAGAISVFNQLLINKGNNIYKGKPLFHGAIMNSGSIFRAAPSNSTKAQRVFDTLIKAAGCGHNGCASSHTYNPMECLRKISHNELVSAMNSLPDFMSNRSNDLAYLPRPDPTNDFFSVSPEVAVALGQFARVPVILGNQQDEAALFSLSQRDFINSTSTLVEYMHSWFVGASQDLVADLVATYPDDPAAGLPADTGSEWEMYPQFKRLAAIQSDLTFIMTRREALSHLATRVPTWSYLSTYLHGFPVFGTWHISDIPTQFENITQFAGNVTDTAYINFVNHLNPNGKGYTWWPEWDNENLRMINFSASTTEVIKDDFRWESYEFWKKHTTKLRQ